MTSGWVCLGWVANGVRTPLDPPLCFCCTTTLHDIDHLHFDLFLQIFYYYFQQKIFLLIFQIIELNKIANQII